MNMPINRYAEQARQQRNLALRASMAIWPSALILVMIVLTVGLCSGAPTKYYELGAALVAGLISFLGIVAQRVKMRGPKLDEKSRLDLS